MVVHAVLQCREGLVLALKLVAHDVAKQRGQVQAVGRRSDGIIHGVRVSAVNIRVGRVPYVVAPQAHGRV